MYVGFYREVWPDGPAVCAESIRDAVAERNDYPVGRVVGYLESGHGLLDLMGCSDDVLEGRFALPGGPSVVTDGTFVWRLDLSLYVRHYRLGLPENFLAFLNTVDYRVPPIPRERLIKVSRQVKHDLGFTG